MEDSEAIVDPVDTALLTDSNYFWFFVTLSVLVYCLWWITLGEEVRIVSRENDKIWKRVRYADAFANGYRPPFYLCFGSLFFTGSIHTIWHVVSRTVRKLPDVEYERELVSLSDGGTVALDWAVSSIDPTTSNVYRSPSLSDESFPVVYLHHGICGSSKSHYILWMVNALLQTQKYRVVCMVARGCGNVPLTTPQAFLAGRTLDMRESLQRIFERHPTSPVYAVGFSLGAGILAKYLGEEGENSKVSGAVVLSPCWDFMQRTPWHKIWGKRMLLEYLISYAKRNMHMLKKHEKVDLDKAFQAETLEDYDKHTTVKIHGYKDAWDYYRQSSAVQVAHKICTPTLSLNADDDPVCSSKGCPTEASQLGPGLVIARTKRGGHLGWAKTLNARDTWAEDATLAWLEGCNENYNREMRVARIQLLREIENMGKESVKSEEFLSESMVGFTEVQSTPGYQLRRGTDLVKVLRDKSLTKKQKLETTKEWLDSPLTKKNIALIIGVGLIARKVWSVATRS